MGENEERIEGGGAAEGEREDPEAERKRRDEHKAEDNRARQIRQGVIPDPEKEEEESAAESV